MLQAASAGKCLIIGPCKCLGRWASIPPAGVPAFLTSNQRNCRADALSLVMAPAQIVVPFGDEGRRTFRLGPLAAANGVTHTHAHDAMSDVTATVDLCRLVFQRSPELWQR